MQLKLFSILALVATVVADEAVEKKRDIGDDLYVSYYHHTHSYHPCIPNKEPNKQTKIKIKQQESAEN